MKNKIPEGEMITTVLNTSLESITDLTIKIQKRCLIEGCRFGIEYIDKTPKDSCIYCGRKNVSIFKWNLNNDDTTNKQQKTS